MDAPVAESRVRTTQWILTAPFALFFIHHGSFRPVERERESGVSNDRNRRFIEKATVFFFLI